MEEEFLACRKQNQTCIIEATEEEYAMPLNENLDQNSSCRTGFSWLAKALKLLMLAPIRKYMTDPLLKFEV